MRKFVSLLVASTALVGLASACTVDAPVEEGLGSGEEAACANPQGTNATIASLAVAIGQELGRWQVTTDFKWVNLYPWYPVMTLSSAGLAQCSANGSSCSMVKALLSWQDPKFNGKIKFADGTVLSPDTYQARLYSGYQEQVVCESRPPNNTNPNNCPAEAHKLTLQGTSPGVCEIDYTFKATKTTGAPLTAPAQLINKLLWARKEYNPYIAFQSTASTVTIDPLWFNRPTPSQSGGSCIVVPTNPYPSDGADLSGGCCKLYVTSAPEKKFYAMAGFAGMYECK
jgi:hypothetical protein